MRTFVVPNGRLAACNQTNILHDHHWSTIWVSSDQRSRTIAWHDCFCHTICIYRYHLMSFGLKTAPQTFQRLIDSFRNWLGYILTLAYLGDIIVLAPDFDEHLVGLKQEFERLHQFKLKSKREKCKFACPHVKYLGNLITCKWIQVHKPRRDNTDIKHGWIQNCQTCTVVHPDMFLASSLCRKLCGTV